jgi:hypothetical protein
LAGPGVAEPALQTAAGSPASWFGQRHTLYESQWAFGPSIQYRRVMIFDSTAIPLSAPTAIHDHHSSGTGFVIQMNGQTYIATTAHLATDTESIPDDWSLWADEIIVWDAKGQQSEKFPLFDLNEGGNRLPRFKFLRAFDTPEVLVDAILLPLAADNPVVGRTTVFSLPAAGAICQKDEIVTAVGYLQQPWPSLATGIHKVTGADIPIFSVSPAPVKGFSGGPVVNSSGQLVGMGFGSGNQHAPSEDDGLMVPVQIFVAMTAAVDGRIP